MDTQNTGDTAPPHPQAVLRIGVTGHRIGAKLSETQAGAVRATVENVVAEIARLARETVERDAWAFSSRRPLVSVISPLAEGADRLVADAGLNSGMPLNVILPFARDEYRRDFTTAPAQAEFDRLLSKAETVFELNGKRAGADRAYEAAGLLMLANADILIAVWNQEPATGVGGTAVIVEHAVADGVPIILIDPARPDETSILWRADLVLPTARTGMDEVPRRPLPQLLPGIISAILAPPGDGAERRSLEALFAERERRWNFSLSYPVLLFLTGVRRLRWTDLRVPDHRADSATRWQDYIAADAHNASISPVVTGSLLHAYSVVDHISIHYAQVYRSAYVFNYAASALAVLLALSSLVLPISFKPFTMAIEIVLIVSILFVIGEGARRQWHRRWLEYRMMAETLRHLRVLALMGAAARLDRPGHRGARARGWVSWYARAIERAIPMPNLAVDLSYLSAVRDAVCKAELKAQVSYHHRNAHVMELAGERLHFTGSLLFAATLAVCVCYLGLYFFAHPVAVEYREWAVFLTALFPTVGAAINAIRAQGDFQSVADRSRETALVLDELDAALEREPLEFARLADRIGKAADLMMADLAEWHVLFRTRPLSLPA